MAAEFPRRAHGSVELIYENLKCVLRGGVRPAQLVRCLELLELDVIVERSGSDDPYARAVALEAVLSVALSRLGQGPHGRAARILFGVESDVRGRPLKDRRRLAAYELGVLPSTFRRNYEADLIRDVAVEVWRYPRALPPESD